MAQDLEKDQSLNLSNEVTLTTTNTNSQQPQPGITFSDRFSNNNGNASSSNWGPELQRTTSHNPSIVVEFRRLSLEVSESIGRRDSSLKLSRSVSNLDLNSKKSRKLQQDEYFEKLEFQTREGKYLCQAFNVDPSKGLDSSTAAQRLQRDGPNMFSQKRPNYLWKLLGYLFGGFCSVLWIGVITYFICWRPPLSNPPSATNLALAILVIIVIVLQAMFTAFQDWSTNRVMKSILNLLPAECIVLRDGQITKKPATELVVGDIVMFKSGDKIPADMRIIESSSDLRFDRSILTGESEEIDAFSEVSDKSFLEANNVALMGTHCTNGQGKGLVVLTGEKSVIGGISKLTSNTKQIPTLIQLEISRFVKIIIGCTVFLVALLVIMWAAYVRRYHPGFITVVGLLDNCMGCVVAFIPEGMPVAVTLTLSLVAKRMKSQNVLPKSLSTVETLGCITVLCSDKTGTLTENKMFVQSVGFVDEELTLENAKRKCILADDESDYEKTVKNTRQAKTAIEQLQRASLLCNDAKFDAATMDLPLNQRVINGNATDAAVLRFAEDMMPNRTYNDALSHVFTIPFNSTNKWMLSMYKETNDDRQDGDENEDYLIYLKGAPDVVFKACTSYFSAKDNQVYGLNEKIFDQVVQLQESWARKGQRVIALCSRRYKAKNEVGTNMFSEEIATNAFADLTIIGLLGIIDPPRSDILNTVNECRRAGTRFFMVTGDFKLTAVAIARQVGIITSEYDPETIKDVEEFVSIEAIPTREEFNTRSLVLEGRDLENLEDNHWDVICCYEEVVFSRTTPEQKLNIVNAYKNRDQVVGVTGDGVNDAPALRAANVGIAIVTGSDVALEAADLILLGSFSSITEGMRLGRLVFQNLQKVISYLLPAGSWSEIWPVLVNVFLGVPLPLSSFLMIIICVFTDLFQCLTLIMEKEEFDLLTLPPRNHKREHLINLKIYIQSYLFMGTMETIIAHTMFFLYMYREAGIPVGDLFLAFNNYSAGFHGYTEAELIQFNNTGQCVYFVCLVILQWGNLLSIRNRRLSILQADPIRKKRRNLWLAGGALMGLIIAIFVTEVPGLNSLFGTSPVPIEYWLLPLPFAVAILCMDEIRKLLVRVFPNGPIAKIAW